MSEIVHHSPSMPNRVAAHAASGMRAALMAVEKSIGGSVSPAPPSVASSTTSAHTTSCERLAIRR